MAIKFDFNKLRTAVGGWLAGTDTAGTSLTAGEEAIYVPKMRSAKMIKSLAANASLTAEDSGKLLNLNVASGCTITLPAATGTGIEYHFVVLTTVTSNNYVIQVASADDTIDGLVLNCDDDSSDAVAIWKTAAASDTITLDGSTKGGIIGDTFKLTDIGTGQWLIHAAATSGTGTVATPFSAAVS